MKKKFIVNWQAIYSMELEVEAKTKEEAIQIAQKNANLATKEFIEFDYYEAEETD